MYLSFDINTKEGDKVLVSLSSSYSYIHDVLPAGIPDFDLVEVSIIRESGSTPIRMEVFRKIAEILVSIAEDNPASVLFYFCDFADSIPRQRHKNMPPVVYRNSLFKLLFARYKALASEHWSDIEVVLQSDTPKLEMYAHFLLRDRHLPLVELLQKEVRDNFEAISGQK